MLNKKHKIAWCICAAVLLLLTCFIQYAQPMTFGKCVSECQTDVMYVSDCMKDEQNYWDADISKHDLKESCIQLIRNERIDCYSSCARQEAENNSASLIYKFYDTEVQFFPNNPTY